MSVINNTIIMSKTFSNDKRFQYSSFEDDETILKKKGKLSYKPRKNQKQNFKQKRGPIAKEVINSIVDLTDAL